jgi:mediator of RNA polymerase II transcription subunit 18, fungi type
MHELFLTASVNPADFETACAILQGLTWMNARRSVYRILYFAGQPQPTGLPKAPARVMLPRQQERQLWADLNKQLLRSSYILQANFEVSPEVDFGKEAPMDLPRLPATLRWTDLPDPLKDPQAALRKKTTLQAPNVPEPVKDSPITSRKKIEIPFATGLVVALSENKQT